MLCFDLFTDSGQKKRLATKLHVINKKGTTLGAHMKMSGIEGGIK